MDSAVAAGAFFAVASGRSSCLPALEALGVFQLCLPEKVCLAEVLSETLGQAAEASCLPVEEQQGQHQQPVPLEQLLLPQPVVAAFVIFGDVESAGECVALVQGLDVGLHSKPKKACAKCEKSRPENKINDCLITCAPLRPGAPGLGILLGETWPGEREPIE